MLLSVIVRIFNVVCCLLNEFFLWHEFCCCWMLLSGLVSTFTASAVAHSAAERFALLEERDKFLRSSMLTTFTFNNVAYEEGICLSLSCHLQCSLYCKCIQWFKYFLYNILQLHFVSKNEKSTFMNYALANNQNSVFCVFCIVLLTLCNDILINVILHVYIFYFVLIQLLGCQSLINASLIDCHSSQVVVYLTLKFLLEPLAIT